MASRSIICLSRHWQITIFCDNRVQELFYHLITEFVFFNEYPRETKRSAIFTQRRSQEREKHGFLYACAQYNLQPNTVGRHCAWADHFFFAGHVVGSWLMKRKKNLLRMIMNTYGENNNDGDNDGEYYNMLCIFFKNFLKLVSFLFFFSWKRFELE